MLFLVETYIHVFIDDLVIVHPNECSFVQVQSKMQLWSFEDVCKMKGLFQDTAANTLFICQNFYSKHDKLKNVILHWLLPDTSCKAKPVLTVFYVYSAEWVKSFNRNYNFKADNTDFN